MINIVINDINKKNGERIEKHINDKGGEAVFLYGNVLNKNDVDQIVEYTINKYGNIHILINNAGVLKPTKVINTNEDEWDWIIGVNLKGTFLFSKAVLVHMRKNKWGRIINFSSTAGKNVSTVGGAHYTASKAGVLGFTRHLAKEEAIHGITVNAICPGLIDTEMVRKTISKEKIKEYSNSFPIKRLGKPIEVAGLIGYLIGDESSYITGASLDINGGDLMI